jgi:hypothetical protein
MGQIKNYLYEQIKPFTPIDYATSSREKHLPPPWSILGALLRNNTARVLYVVPFAGYIILYSDYFEQLFRFSHLHRWGFLTFGARVDLIYYGSLVLLVAFAFFWFFAPPLLRGRQDRTQFVSDHTLARDAGTVAKAAREAFSYLGPYLDAQTSLNEEDRSTLAALRMTMSRGHRLGRSAGEYEDLIPRMLIFYFNWQNYGRPWIRALVFCLTIVGYSMLLLPSIDLFLRVTGTTISHFSSPPSKSQTPSVAPLPSGGG